MKQNRRRRHLRPRPTRSQINQQIGRVRSAIQLFQMEWLLEAQQEQPSLGRASASSMKPSDDER